MKFQPLQYPARLLAGLALLFLIACRSPASREEPPPLPKLAVERFVPAAREQVEKAYQEAQANPNNPGVNGRLGMVLHAYEQFGAAEACYRRARAFQPKEFRWAYLLGAAQASAGNNQEAARSLRAAVKLDGEYAPARVKLAEALLALGELGESREIFEALAAKHPEFAPAHYGAGRARAAQGDLPGAIEHYRKASELAPQFGGAHYGLALAYQKLGDTAKAQAEMALYRKDPLGGAPAQDALLDQVKALNQSAQHHLKEGVRLEAEGHLQESIAEHEQAVALDPKMIQAHTNLITLYAKAGNAAKSEEHYRATVTLNPNLAETHYDYGVLLFEQRRYQEAAETFRKAVEINPNYAEALGNLGFLSMLEGKLDQAERQYRAALQNRPNYRLAHFQLGRLLLNRGRTEEAIAHFQQTLGEEGPGAPGYVYALGAACARAGRREQALAYLREARDKAAALGQTELLGSIERDLRAVEQK